MISYARHSHYDSSMIDSGPPDPKVHLLLSVLLTNQTPHGINFYGTRAISNKVDQLMSTLHSISKLKLSSQAFYVSFGEEYLWAQDIVNKQIRKVFPNSSISNSRLDSFASWKAASELIPEDADVVLLNANHDHAFLPESIEVFEQFVKDIQVFGTRYVGAVTHWPEEVSRPGLKWARSENGRDGIFQTSTNSTIGTCLVSRILFCEWWENDFTNGMKIVRPDNPFGPSVKFALCPLLIPATELFRHLDGYFHVKITSPSAQALRPCCTVSNGRILHLDWARGYFSLKATGVEIPFIPSDALRGQSRPLLELSLLASSHRINLKTLQRLITKDQSHEWSRILFFLIMLLTNRHFLKKIPISIWGLARVLLANWYRRLQARHSFLPPTLRDLARVVARRTPAHRV